MTRKGPAPVTRHPPPAANGMAHTCSKCSRVNPPEAAYCYFDGNTLPGHGPNGGGPRSLATRAFRHPFVFPSGRQCRNFDELAVACQDEWDAARDMLGQGFLEGFLNNLGRPDLAQAARDAARFPDRDRGLDQLLGRLPSQVLDAPRLRVEPQEISLGTLPVGQDRTFALRLENLGQRLLYGSVAVDDCVWLAVGDGAGTPQKLFQFGQEAVVPVHVRGKQLRAGAKPLEGRLVVESNAGTVTVVARVQVPAVPFPDGPLAGATTPRELAQKAKATLDKARASGKAEAAAVVAAFEKGKVAGWYAANGWAYPVQGPAASGLGVVQQFFEALGLTPPPRVEIGERAVALQGDVGAHLRHALTVSSAEKRPVYAHAASDAPWLEVGRARLNGRAATIPLVVPAVPNRPGETLTARVTVTSNGQQKFVVPVTLAVTGFNFADLAAPAAPPPVAPPAPKKAPEPVAQPAAPPRPRTAPPWLVGLARPHLVPAALLVVALLGILAWDLIAPPTGAAPGGGRDPDAVHVEPADVPYADLEDPRPKLGVEFQLGDYRVPRGRFGITMLDEPDPNNEKALKRLTYEANGSTNNTCVKLDDKECLFGLPPGRWVRNKALVKARNRERWTSEWVYPEQVYVTQVVELVPGQTRRLDTVLVHYAIENRSHLPHVVGLRVMLDTFIGANDGVPFRIPGRSTFLQTREDFSPKDMPDYVQAWERADLKNPGTIAHLGLKGIELPGVHVEPILKLRICHWPENPDARWTWDPKPIDDPPEKKDSCVVLYWDERKTEVGERRDLAFTYGLNGISSTESGNAELSLTAGGSFRVGGEFTLTATVKNPQPGQAVTVQLPAGLALERGEEAEQALGGGGDYGQVSWRIRSTAPGEYRPVVTTAGLKESYKVRITTKSIFD